MKITKNVRKVGRKQGRIKKEANKGRRKQGKMEGGKKGGKEGERVKGGREGGRDGGNEERTVKSKAASNSITLIFLSNKNAALKTLGTPLQNRLLTWHLLWDLGENISLADSF